jgi:SAM-dependent methyltransferase
VRDLAEQFGQIDIYLFDQLLRGRLVPSMRVFDAGCGTGRNLVYLLRSGFDVFGADSDERAIQALRRLPILHEAGVPPDHFRVERLEALSFPDAFADVVLSSAVLHFARDDEQFGAMLRGSWRVLKPGGMLFCRLASTIGMEARMRQVAGRRYQLPDGSERYLVDEPMLMRWTRDLGGDLLVPLKTTVVQDERCMTTWILRKRPERAG